MIDKTIRELADQMYELINSYKLPLEVKRLVMSEVYTTLKKATEDEISRQILASKVEEGEKDAN